MEHAKASFARLASDGAGLVLEEVLRWFGIDTFEIVVCAGRALESLGIWAESTRHRAKAMTHFSAANTLHIQLKTAIRRVIIKAPSPNVPDLK